MKRAFLALALLPFALRSPAAEPEPIPVALYVGLGVSGKGPSMLEAAAKKTPDLKLKVVTAADIREGKLKDYRVLVMPGGSGAGQADAIGPAGRDAIKSFVDSGGCYVGICAGCYLASTGYDWSLDLLPAKVIDRAHWKRGEGTIDIEFTSEAKTWLDRKDATVCRYANGPILEPLPGAKEKLLVFAHFRSEFVPPGAKPGVMKDTPAMVAARYGKGWAIGISPHPEQTDDLKDVVPAMIRKALGTARE